MSKRRMSALSIPYLVAERRRAYRDIVKAKLLNNKQDIAYLTACIHSLDSELKRRHVTISDPELLESTEEDEQLESQPADSP